MTDIPIVLTSAGRQPQTPQALLAQLIALVTATNPGYTANLPGSLIEDISSTDVGALTITDSAVTELINSLTPYGANAFLLTMLGNIYGVQQGVGSNTSVYCVFSGPAGFVVGKGFVVSDGSHQYTVQDGGIIASGGATSPLFCLATEAGSWAVPSGTVTTLVTSVPGSISLTVTNPNDGLASTGAQTEEDFRAQVLQAGVAAAQGMPTFVKAQLDKVSGVQSRLVSIRTPASNQWEVIVGGGDPYEVAYAIFTGLFDISNLVGSTIGITGITKANPGVVTTNLNHGLTTTQSNVHISGVLGMTAANGGPYTVTVITEKTFSFGVDTTGFGVYTSGGVVTPNSRNVSVSIDDYPDTYVIPFVVPPQQPVIIDLVWNTTSTNLVSEAAVAQLGTPALVDYINSIAVGQAINLFEMQNVFQEAIVSLIPPTLLSRMVFTVTINGVVTAVTSGTGLYVGDPESYFLTDAGSITITQG